MATELDLYKAALRLAVTTIHNLTVGAATEQKIDALVADAFKHQRELLGPAQAGVLHIVLRTGHWQREINGIDMGGDRIEVIGAYPDAVDARTAMVNAPTREDGWTGVSVVCVEQVPFPSPVPAAMEEVHV